ncbi:YveK family protein [Amedibacillus sp. YH-ame6]
MNENINTERKSDEIEIDLSQFFLLLKKHVTLIVISTTICAAISLLITVFFIEKKYASTETIYLTPKVTEQGTVDASSVNSNTILVNNYVLMIKGENVLSKVAEKLDLPSVDEVKAAVSVSNEPDTQIINVIAKTDDPTKSKQIAETTVDIFFTEMKDKLNIENLTIIDSAKINTTAVSPSKKVNLLFGAFIGIALSCGYVFLKFILDKRLKNSFEAESFLGIPVLVEIPYYRE